MGISMGGTVIQMAMMTEMWISFIAIIFLWPSAANQYYGRKHPIFYPGWLSLLLRWLLDCMQLEFESVR